jgi:Papain-like cysteine protease AvrRpt2
MTAVIPLPLPPDDRATRSIVVAQPLQLKGRYDATTIATLQVQFDQGEICPIGLTPTGQWQFLWPTGWTTIGAHWLQILGFDRSGELTATAEFYFMVCPDAAMAPMRLRLLQDSWFKATPQDSTQLPARQKVRLLAGQTYEVLRYGWTPAHLQLRLRDPIDPIGDWGYLDPDQVELRQGDIRYVPPLVDPVERPIDGQLQVTRTTHLKAQLTDSTRAPYATQQLIQGQVLPLTAAARADDHWRVRLPGVAGDRTGDRAWVSAIDVRLTPAPDPAPLTLEILQTTPLKQRPLSPALLPLTAKVSLAPGQIYALQHYAMVGESQLKVTLRSAALPVTTGYLDAAHVQLRWDATVRHPGQGQLELAVPVPQRGGALPDHDWPIANLLAIAAVLGYYHRPADVDRLRQWCFDHYGLGSQVDPTCLQALLQTEGCQIAARTNWTAAELRATLQQQVPIVLATRFTPARHWVVLVGYGPRGWRLYDPWGDATTGYRDRIGDRVDCPLDYFAAMVGADGAIAGRAIRARPGDRHGTMEG